MKSIIFLIVLLMHQIMVFAQPDEGRVIAGPTVYFVNQQTNNYMATGYPNGYKQTLNNLTLTLQGGYFISENFCLGLSASYMDNTENTQNPPKPQYISNSKTWEYGLFARHYIKITDQLYFTNSFVMTLESGTNVATYQYSAPATDSSSSLGIKGYLFSYAPGLIYYLSHHVGVKTNIGVISYLHTTVTTTSGDGTGTSYTNGVFSILSPLTSFNVGVDFFFGKTNGK